MFKIGKKYKYKPKETDYYLECLYVDADGDAYFKIHYTPYRTAGNKMCLYKDQYDKYSEMKETHTKYGVMFKGRLVLTEDTKEAALRFIKSYGEREYSLCTITYEE